MRYSDDESEVVTRSVTSYYFEDEEEEPVCFSVLPIQWSKDQTPNDMKSKIFLRGTADGGLQKIFKQVTAWKVDLTKPQPEVSVFSKEKNWILLLKPKKSFEDTIRTIWITLHFLHFVKKNPEKSGKALWNHLLNVFSLYKVRPSENDLRDHLPFLNFAVKHDRMLSNSKVLLAFLENPRKRKAFTEDTAAGSDVKKTKFIVDDDYEESDEEIGPAIKDDSDSVCALCDNGGSVLCCDGECFRCFHATVAAAGVDSNCKSLGLSKAELKEPKFYCLNCQYKQHQCFACGKLGSSDKSSGAEVFRCDSAFCGRFYHPECVAELLHPGKAAEVKELHNRVIAGESFTCPAHKCCVCKKAEKKNVYQLQFAICRRCPRAYHRKCLPREIAFENSEDDGIVPRAWDDLLPNRILIYCLKHEIEGGLATPANPILFPDVDSSRDVVVNRKRMISDDFRRSISAKTQKQVEKVTFTKESQSTENINKRFSVQGLDATKRLSTSGASKKLLNDGVKSVRMKKSSTTEPLVDAEAKKRVVKLMEDSASSITLKDVIREYKSRSKQAYSKVVDKAIAREKVEGSIQAVQTASQKVEEGSSFEYAKDVFEPEILNRITEWKVVDRLHWYVRKDDTIVNLSCGANDFTCLLKQRLEEIGKECSFKHYDVCEPKNDWMSVNRVEAGLPTGATLIMAITLPVGVKSALADKFVTKAQEFKPKLLILFVPEDAKRLDKLRYELVWEDTVKLVRKSLPSSVNMNDTQLKQWNSKPPVVYLWSRIDWSAEYKAIALRVGHNTSNSQSTHHGDESKDDDEPVSISTRILPRDHFGNRKKQKRLLIDDQSEDLEAVPSSQSSSSVRNEETGAGKVNSLPPLLGSPAGCDSSFLDFIPGPFLPCSHEQHSSCGWIDDE